MCTKFRYCFMMSGCQSVEMSRSYVSTSCIQVSGFEFKLQSLSQPQCCPTTNILIYVQIGCDHSLSHPYHFFTFTVILPFDGV